MKNSLIKNIWRNLFAGILLTGIWHFTAMAVNRDLYLPSPLKTFKEMAILVTQPSFWIISLGTVMKVIMGLLLSIITGFIFGFASAFNKTVHAVLHPVVVIVKSTPVVSFILIAVFLFTTNLIPVFIGFLMSFPILWTSVVDGIRQVDNKLLEMARVFKVNRWLVIKKIYIPSMIPFVSSALKIAFGLTWKVTVAAEVLSNPEFGIGTRLINAKIYLDTTILYAWTGFVIIMSLIFEWILNLGIRALGKRYMRNGRLNDLH